MDTFETRRLFKLGNGKLYPFRVPLFSTHFLPNRNIAIPNAYSDPEKLYEVPIAFSLEESFAFEQERGGLFHGAQTLFRALYLPPNTYSFELQITQERAQYQIVGVDPDVIQHRIEGHFPKTEVLPFKQVGDGNLAKSITTILNQEGLQRQFDLTVFYVCPKRPPHAVLTPPVTSNAQEHTSQAIIDLHKHLDDPLEGVNFRLQFAAAPVEFNHLIQNSQALSTYASILNPKQAKANGMQQGGGFDKASKLRPIFAVVIVFVAITKKQHTTNVVDTFLTFIEGYRYGDAALKLISLDEFCQVGIAKQDVRNSLIERTAFCEGALFTDIELASLLPYPNRNLLLESGANMPMVKADRVPRERSG